MEVLQSVGGIDSTGKILETHIHAVRRCAAKSPLVIGWGWLPPRVAACVIAVIHNMLQDVLVCCQAPRSANDEK